MNIINYFNLSITNGCNMSCTYCYKNNKNLKNATTIKKEDFIFIVEKLRNENNIKPKTIFISGGEPLTYDNDILLEVINEYNDFVFQIATNGTIDLKYFVDRLKNKNVTFVMSYDVDNDERIGFNHQQFEKNLKILNETDFHVHLNPTYNHKNIKGMLYMYEAEKENKKKNFTFGWNIAKRYPISLEDKLKFEFQLKEIFNTIMKDLEQNDYTFIPDFLKGLFGFALLDKKMKPHCENEYRIIIDVNGNVFPCNIISQDIENSEQNILNNEDYHVFKKYVKHKETTLYNIEQFLEDNKDASCGLKCTLFPFIYEILRRVIYRFLEYDNKEHIKGELIRFANNNYPCDLAMSSVTNHYAFKNIYMK